MDEKSGVVAFCSTINSLFELYDLLKCCICLEMLKDPITLKCKHTFCTDCLKSSQSNACPLCRKISNKRDKSPNEAAEKLSIFIRNVAEQIESATEIDNPNAMKIIKQYNKTLQKPVTKPSTSKPSSPIKKSAIKPISKTTPKSQEPQNLFDVLLESSRNQACLKKSFRMYRNKKKKKDEEKVVVTDKIQEFQNGENKEKVVKWLMDSQNDFDRITQTQQGPVRQNSEDAKFSSVSQDLENDGISYYHELNEVKRRRAELRRYGSFAKRCRSLDVQIRKPIRGRLKRQSISCDSPDFEDNDISGDDTGEAAQEVEKLELFKKIEEESLRSLEGNSKKIESHVGTLDIPESLPIPGSAWERMKKLNESIRKSERQPKQLKIFRASSLKKIGEQNKEQMDGLNMEDVESFFRNNPSINLDNIQSRFKNVKNKNLGINYPIHLIEAQTFSKTKNPNASSICNSIDDKSVNQIESNDYSIQNVNDSQGFSNTHSVDNPTVNLSEIESFFKKHIANQQSDVDSEYSLYFPEKREQRKNEKRDVDLEKQLSKEVEILSKSAKVDDGCQNIDRNLEKGLVEENSSENQPVVDKNSLKRSTRKPIVRRKANKRRTSRINSKNSFGKGASKDCQHDEISLLPETDKSCFKKDITEDKKDTDSNFSKAIIPNITKKVSVEEGTAVQDNPKKENEITTNSTELAKNIGIKLKKIMKKTDDQNIAVSELKNESKTMKTSLDIKEKTICPTKDIINQNTINPKNTSNFNSDELKKNESTKVISENVLKGCTQMKSPTIPLINKNSLKELVKTNSVIIVNSISSDGLSETVEKNKNYVGYSKLLHEQENIRIFPDIENQNKAAVTVAQIHKSANESGITKKLQQTLKPVKILTQQNYQLANANKNLKNSNTPINRTSLDICKSLHQNKNQPELIRIVYINKKINEGNSQDKQLPSGILPPKQASLGMKITDSKYFGHERVNFSENESPKSTPLSKQRSEPEELLKHVSTLVELFGKENPQFLTKFVRNKAFSNLLQKELEKKLSFMEENEIHKHPNINASSKIKSTTADVGINLRHEINQSINVESISEDRYNHCVTPGQDDLRKDNKQSECNLTDQDSEPEQANVNQEKSRKVSDKSDKIMEVCDNQEQANNSWDSLGDDLFLMPTQKFLPEQTEEVVVIQKSIQKIQDVLTNSSFSSGESELASVRQQINNVQLFLDNLEHKNSRESMKVDSIENLKHSEKNLVIDKLCTNSLVKNAKNAVISKTITDILKYYEEILITNQGMLKYNEKVLKETESQLRVDSELLKYNKEMYIYYEGILESNEEFLSIIQENLKEDNNGINIDSNDYIQILEKYKRELKCAQEILLCKEIFFKNPENFKNVEETSFNEVVLRYNKLLNNGIEIMKNIDIIEMNLNDNLEYNDQEGMNDKYILKNAYRILSMDKENVEVENEIVQIKELVLKKHNESLKKKQVNVSVQIDITEKPQCASKNIQTEIKPLMKNMSTQYEMKLSDQGIQTLVLQNKEKSIQTVTALLDSTTQTDFEDRGFHISSNEAFKTVNMMDVSVQTTEPEIKFAKEHNSLLLSPSFDDLEFETQDVVDDLNKQNLERSVSQILHSLQNQPKTTTKNIIRRNISAPIRSNNKDFVELASGAASTPLVSHRKVVRKASPSGIFQEIIEIDGSDNLKISKCSNKMSPVATKLTPNKSSKDVETNEYYPVGKPFRPKENKMFQSTALLPNSPNSRFNKSFDSTLNKDVTKKLIKRKNSNNSFTSIIDKPFSENNMTNKDVPRNNFLTSASKSSNSNNKANTISKEFRAIPAKPLDIDVVTTCKTLSEESNLVISMDRHPLVPIKDKYKRIRAPSPDSDSEDESCKRFKKLDNRFMRDDISVVFDSETQNKNLEEVSSLGSSGINMDYIDQIWNKIDNGVFDNPATHKENQEEEVTERPSKKLKRDPRNKNSTQELLDKYDQVINNFNKKIETKQVLPKSPIAYPGNAGPSKMPQQSTSGDKFPDKLKHFLGQSINPSDKCKSSIKPQVTSPEILTKSQEIDSNPCSLEKLIDTALSNKSNKPHLVNNKESEDLFQSCLEKDPDITLCNESEADKVVADFITSTMDDRDFEALKSLPKLQNKKEITILQDIVLLNPGENDVTIIEDSNDEADVIDSSPEKSSPVKTVYLGSSRKELFPAIVEVEAIPPPVEFQDFFQVNEDDELLAQIDADRIKDDMTENLDKSVVLPITEKFTDSALLSLSPITKEFSNKSLHLNPLEISTKKKTSSTQRSQKQVSIKSFMCKSKSAKQVAAELFGVKEKTKKPCIACSRLYKDQVIAISALTNKKLATYSTVFNSTVTHMIVTTNDNNCVKDHTIKYVNAVAAGIWVLSFRWVQDSLAKNELLPEEPYEVLDVSGVPGPKEARLHCKTQRLLKGYKIYAAPPFLSTTQGDIENIILTLGGKIVSSPEELLPKGGDICLIITETRSTQGFGQYETWLDALGVVTVDIEWLSHSVGQYKLVSLRRFALCSDDSIMNLGYPEELTANVPYSLSQSIV